MWVYDVNVCVHILIQYMLLLVFFFYTFPHLLLSAVFCHHVRHSVGSLSALGSLWHMRGFKLKSCVGLSQQHTSECAVLHMHMLLVRDPVVCY